MEARLLNFRRMALISALLLTACTPAAPPATGPAQSGGSAPAPVEEKADNQVIRVALKGLVGNMSPQSSAYNFWLYWPMYDNLTQFGKNFEVLHAAWDSAIQRRTQKLISGQRHVDSLRGIASLDEFDPSGCFSVDDVVFGSAYEAALADYLTSCCGEINAFADQTCT